MFRRGKCRIVNRNLLFVTAYEAETAVTKTGVCALLLIPLSTGTWASMTSTSFVTKLCIRCDGLSLTNTLRSEILTSAVKMPIAIFRAVKLRSLWRGYRRFGRMYHLHRSGWDLLFVLFSASLYFSARCCVSIVHILNVSLCLPSTRHISYWYYVIFSSQFRPLH